MSEVPDYYTSAPDWAAYAKRKGISLDASPPVEVAPLDVVAGRADQVIEETKWAQEHPLELVGYQSKIQHVTVRDGHAVEIKVSWPLEYNSGSVGNSAPLPLLLVFHGGGWIQGTHTTEEAWLLWPLMNHLKLVIVSVAYRLAPEHVYPTYIHDCWDVVQSVTTKNSPLNPPVPFNPGKIILSGSSAGALIAASLAQKARDTNDASKIHAVLLNVPVTCDYRSWPASKPNNSYLECEQGALLPSHVMKQVWDIAVPRPTTGDVQASPLLGDLSNLPPHFVYVAGQDPLRDEGIEYARLLSQRGNRVEFHVYPGVPHTFGEIWELDATKKFWQDVVGDLSTVL